MAEPLWTGSERQQMVDAFAAEYQRGDSLRTIAGRHKCSYNTVRRVLTGRGVAMRPANGATAYLSMSQVSGDQIVARVAGVEAAG